MTSAQFIAAVQTLDAANSRDPGGSGDESGRVWPAQLLEARRLSSWIARLDPTPSEALQLAAHCQHLERWTRRARATRPGRVGYKKWRSELARFHAHRAREILSSLGYSEEVLARVEAINLKRDISGDPDTQTMEDALCLVFLEFQLRDFARKHSDEQKLLGILRRTWSKMSDRGRRAALELDYGADERRLLDRALGSAPF